MLLEMEIFWWIMSLFNLMTSQSYKNTQFACDNELAKDEIFLQAGLWTVN